MSDQKYDYDLFIIGGGSGGVRGARWAAVRGAKVALCEDDRMGGTCVIRGCIPKKMMSYASHLPAELKVMEAYGWNTEIKSFDWEKLKINRDKEIDRLSNIYSNILKNNEVDFIGGRGKVIGPHEVEVNGKVFTAKNILIAVGGKPTKPEIPGSELGIVSDQIFHLDKFPKKLVVIGTGYIGLEFASIFKGLGSDVTVLCRGELPLRGFDQDVRKFVTAQFKEHGINLLCQTHMISMEKASDKFTLQLSNGESMIDVDQVLFATGREPNTDGLFSDELKIKLGDDKSIIVNAKSETNIPSIFAVGDVTNRMNLTPVALEEAMYVVENLFEGKSREMNYENIATAVFSDPQIATCGLTEEQCREKKIDVDVYLSDFRGLKYTLTNIQHRTLMKLIVEKTTQKILGLHMAGDDAGEMMQGLAVAIKAGATKQDFDATIGIHPTAAEEWTTMRTPRG